MQGHRVNGIQRHKQGYIITRAPHCSDCSVASIHASKRHPWLSACVACDSRPTIASKIVSRLYPRTPSAILHTSRHESTYLIAPYATCTSVLSAPTESGQRAYASRSQRNETCALLRAAGSIIVTVARRKSAPLSSASASTASGHLIARKASCERSCAHEDQKSPSSSMTYGFGRA